MAVNDLGITVPAGGDPFDPQGDMVALANSLRSRIRVPVANVTARTALLAAIDWTPSAAEPLRVWRADAANGYQEEQTTDSATWKTVIAVSDSGWVPPQTLPGAWDTNSATFKSRLIGNRVELTGLIRPDAGTIAAGTTATGIILAAGHYRAGSPVRMGAVGWVNGGTPPYRGSAVVEIDGTGGISIYANETLTGVFVDGLTYLV